MERAFPMSRVVGEHPWTEVSKSQYADSSWSPESTAFRGVYAPGNSFYFCFFFYNSLFLFFSNSRCTMATM